MRDYACHLGHANSIQFLEPAAKLVGQAFHALALVMLHHNLQENVASYHRPNDTIRR